MLKEMKYLGIDYGTKRIGVAVSDERGRVAFPLIVLRASPMALGEVAALAKEHRAEKIIIGEPRDLKGGANAVMESVDEFARDLREMSGVEVVYELEFFTSAQAARQFSPQEKSRKANPAHTGLDASAAALILQSYLDKHN